MNYDELLQEADDMGLIVKEKSLQLNDGRIKGNRVAIRRDMPTVKKACTLAEEMGHSCTTYGDILEQNSVMDIRQEQRARLWAYNKLIGLQGIIKAHLHRCTSLYDMADYLNVTEEFLMDALKCYRSKYGCYTVVDNYIICFESTVAVIEMYS